MNSSMLEDAISYAGGSGYITRGGIIVKKWGSSTDRYGLKSTTKSIGVTALGLAIKDGKMNLSDLAVTYLPGFGTPPDSNKDTGWLDEITLFHLASQTAGFDKPGGYTSLLFGPGTAWAYSDGGPNWLADCVTLVYNQDILSLFFDRVFTPIGISSSDLTWRSNIYREDTINGIKRREFGSGISANVDAMARIGYLYLKGGNWNGSQILTRDFIDQLRTSRPSVVGLPVTNDPDSTFEGASNHYGLLWWNNADGAIPGAPGDAYWSWGLYDSFIIVIPSLDIVVSRAGTTIPGDRSPCSYKILKPFLEPIARSVTSSTPYSQSPVISALVWEDDSTVISKANGSDNWPMTWGDDDLQYTAYGDGWGFDPRVASKLSLGFASVSGSPSSFTGVNIRSVTGEQTGDGRSGKKASSILMINGTLYIWARNADNNGKESQLAWSTDHSKTWTWSTWKFAEFGYPAFINFGKNYSGARDSYVYIYSPDTPDAYNETDNIVLMRVPGDKIKLKSSYMFFTGFDIEGKPEWSTDITKRAPVFSFTDACNRISASYNQQLDRYLLTNRSRSKAGGLNQFSIFDAPEPWGPWTLVYYENQTSTSSGGWGEAQNIPAKWIGSGGETFHIVYSGDDSFSVRKGTFIINSNPDTNVPQAPSGLKIID